MIKSMTGFGAAEGGADGCRVAVEVRSVNHRFFNPTVKLPPAVAAIEPEVRDRLRRHVARGHVTLAVRTARTDAAAVQIDEPRVERYVAQLRSVRDRLGLAGDVDLATVLRLPDVLVAGDEREPAADPSVVLAVTDAALAQLDAARGAEGEQIAAYLLGRLSLIEEALDRLAARAPERVRAQYERLRAQVAELGGAAGADPQRIAQEIAILADRVDVAEELSRFRTHIGAFRETVESGGGDGVGKRLGFLLQEMLREANTTGSKAADAAMLADVVLIKEELERLREQSENVE